MMNLAMRMCGGGGGEGRGQERRGGNVIYNYCCVASSAGCVLPACCLAFPPSFPLYLSYALSLPWVSLFISPSLVKVRREGKGYRMYFTCPLPSLLPSSPSLLSFALISSLGSLFLSLSLGEVRQEGREGQDH